MEDSETAWSAALPRSTSDRARALAPAALLVVVALMGVRNHIVRDQSSWQGASFGMFATYDNGVSRAVLASLEQDGTSTRLAVPADLRDDARRLAVVPTRGAARSLAKALLDRVARSDGATVRVEVRALELDGAADLRVQLDPVVEAAAGR